MAEVLGSRKKETRTLALTLSEHTRETLATMAKESVFSSSAIVEQGIGVLSSLQEKEDGGDTFHLEVESSWLPLKGPFELSDDINSYLGYESPDKGATGRREFRLRLTTLESVQSLRAKRQYKTKEKQSQSGIITAGIELLAALDRAAKSKKAFGAHDGKAYRAIQFNGTLLTYS